jgi:uncharacterized protein YqgV (UPF0045/DUF77 family)
VLRVEFTVEPFVEGQPGPHVNAALDAVRACGVVVDVGPFGSSFQLERDTVGFVVNELLTAAYGHGATHVQIRWSPP